MVRHLIFVIIIDSDSMACFMCVVFNMQKCMGGVNQDCITANAGEEWKCFMAQVSEVANN